LILNGWTGALVEPDPQPLYALEKLYYHNPSIQIIDNAIDNYNEKIMMHCSGTHLNMGDMGLLSTINEKEKDRWHNETFTEVEVDVIDFKTLLDITKLTTIDFISIDAEGSDYRILEQIDLKALNCQMVCVEYNNIDGMKYVKYMEKFGFKVIMMNGCNIIMAL
jgi:FkbM family methyltransferase